ncbi:MAG: tryptophan--tRNA ligase [Proteobacteria bacterium]|nr:tryptophan--tRNA ligase [Pseudomonadota bacterium]
METKQNKVILTGIKPTGHPHLGNYCGAIKPMIEFANNKQDDETIYMFIPDIHSLNGSLTAAQIREFSYSLIASYLACGLNPEKAIIFRQSAVRQHAELATLLTNVTSKGLMNRAHSYKAAVDKNTTANEPEDAGINMGLYNYPILMAADILLYQTNTVPVGKDQIQHIEMTRDIAGTFNSRYSDTFTLPDYESKEDAPEIKGLDGRKMSKSYGNHIPIFCEENELKSLIKKIITDSAKPEEPKKDVENSTLVQLYALFADTNELQSYKDRLAKGGFSYGDAKQELFELINADLAMKRQKYKHYMENRKELDAILEANEEKARRVAEKTIRKVKKKMGLVAG